MSLTRRELLAASAAAAAGAATGCGFGGDDGPPDGFVRAGRLDELRPGGFDAIGPGDRPLAYLRRDGDAVSAIDATCTHLGCPVRYVESSERFICPCHGGVFDRDGDPKGGPVRSPLLRRETKVIDGVIYVGPRRGVLEI